MSVRHSRFALLNFHRFALSLPAGSSSISLTMCVFIAYFFCYCSYCWLWLLPLHIYAFVCPKNGAQKTHQRNCNSRNGTEPCTICICMHFAWQFQLQRHWQWHGSQKMAKDSGSGAGAAKCASFAWKIAFLCAPHFTLADLRFLHFSLTFFPCLSCFPLPASRFSSCPNSVCNATIVLHINGFRVCIYRSTHLSTCSYRHRRIASLFIYCRHEGDFQGT